MTSIKRFSVFAEGLCPIRGVLVADMLSKKEQKA
ncbi:Uncharacterised protein [Streptococcus equi subsp. equi]|nr:Uncharacterised protein [Streptococcus equi subsp. equi]